MELENNLLTFVFFVCPIGYHYIITSDIQWGAWW